MPALERVLLLSLGFALGACSSAPELTHEGRPLSAWVADLGAPGAEQRLTAIEAVAAMGRRAGAAVPALILRGDDPDPRVALAAARALVAVGPDAIAPLERALDVHAPPLRRLHAAWALLQLVPAHEWAASVMLECFASLDRRAVADRARDLVVALGPLLVDRLAALVDDPYLPLRVRALEALGAQGSPAAVSAIDARLSSPDPEVRAAAARARATIAERSSRR